MIGSHKKKIFWADDRRHLDGTLKVLIVGYNEQDKIDVATKVNGFEEFQRPPFENPVGAAGGVELNASIFLEGLGGKMVYGLRKRLPRGHGLVNDFGPTPIIELPDPCPGTV